MRQVLALLPVLLLLSSFAQAGIFEISATGNYRKTYYDSTHSTAMESGTFGLAYYFWELSALELSFTRGDANQVAPEYTAYQTFTAYGVDFLVTMANRESVIKPYLKAGASYIVKSLRYFDPVLGGTSSVNSQGIAPTAGIGFKIMIGQQFAIKTGVDVSSSPLPGDDRNPVTYDFSANAGVSFLF